MPEGLEYSDFYAKFPTPISTLDCGKKCAPYNENGVPFCCDTHHAVATAYQDEWQYLQTHTGLWRLWQGKDPGETARLRDQAPANQVLVVCLGASLCQRNYRTLTCRAFPFFPYITLEGQFIGLSYYWKYEDRCWVISNLSRVTPEYQANFIGAYDELFERKPQEKESFRAYSTNMRRVFARRRRAIPLLHRNGHAYKISPRSGGMRRVRLELLPKFGPYRIADLLPFPGEDSS